MGEGEVAAGNLEEERKRAAFFGLVELWAGDRVFCEWVPICWGSDFY